MPRESFFYGPHYKGYMRDVRETKRLEAKERNAIHDNGEPCESPACPYRPGGQKEGTKALIKRISALQEKIPVLLEPNKPEKTNRRHNGRKHRRGKHDGKGAAK